MLDQVHKFSFNVLVYVFLSWCRSTEQWRGLIGCTDVSFIRTRVSAVDHCANPVFLLSFLCMLKHVHVFLSWCRSTEQGTSLIGDTDVLFTSARVCVAGLNDIPILLRISTHILLFWCKSTEQGISLIGGCIIYKCTCLCSLRILLLYHMNMTQIKYTCSFL